MNENTQPTPENQNPFNLEPLDDDVVPPAGASASNNTESGWVQPGLAEVGDIDKPDNDYEVIDTEPLPASVAGVGAERVSTSADDLATEIGGTAISEIVEVK